MDKCAKLLQQRIARALEPHGAVGEFCRKTGFSRAGVERWRDGDSSPTVANLDRIADALGTTPAALLAPSEDPDAQAIADLKMVLADPAIGEGFRRQLELMAESVRAQRKSSSA